MSERPAKVIRTENASGVPGAKETKSLAEGPFSILEGAVREEYRVFIQCRSQKALIGHVMAYDKHFNLVLRDVNEISGMDSEKAPRSIKHMFLRGESVIFIVKLKSTDME